MSFLRKAVWPPAVGWNGLNMKPSAPDKRCSRLMMTLKLNNLQILSCLHFPRSRLRLFLPLPPWTSWCPGCTSAGAGWGPRRSWEGRTPTGRWSFLRTSSRRSGWSEWWCRPRGSPAPPRSPAQSRTGPCSWAAPGLSATQAERGELAMLSNTRQLNVLVKVYTLQKQLTKLSLQTQNAEREKVLKMH